MNKQQQLFLISLVGIILMASTIMNTQRAEARNEGFEDGKKAGANDARNDGRFDDDCPSSNALYCIAYTAGYRFGWELGNSIK